MCIAALQDVRLIIPIWPVSCLFTSWITSGGTPPRALQRIVWVGQLQRQTGAWDTDDDPFIRSGAQKA